MTAAGGQRGRSSRLLTPEEEVEDEAPQGGGLVRVRQLLQSVQKSVNKTFAKSPAAGILRAKVAGHYTETPNDVQELLNRFTKGQEVLLQIPAKRAEYADSMEIAVAAKGMFDTLLRELGETRSTYQLAEMTTAVADTLLKMQDVQSRAEQGVVEFLFTMGRQERKYTATVSEQVSQLDTMRKSLDKVITKQKIASVTGGPNSDPEKVERRKQKTAARRLAFEDKIAHLRKTVPETELEADVAYCQALITMLREQRQSVSAAALMLVELDMRMEETQALAAETLLQLKGKQQQESKKRELAVAQVCGPRIVEMLASPDFAAALSIAELCASPGGHVEEGEECLRCLLRLLDDSDLCVPLLKFAISQELPRNPPEAAAVALFRVPSLAGALCSVAMQMTGDAYLKASLTPLVVQICSGEADFEIDVRLLSEDDALEVNVDNLCKAVQWFMDTVVQSCRDAPVLLRSLCMHIFNIAGPKQRPLARRIAGALVVDAFLCAAIRDASGRGLLEAAPDSKSQRVLEHIARSLSRAVDDAGGEATAAASVFAAAAMSDFALDLPAPPEELLNVIYENRNLLVGEGGLVDQLAGISDFEEEDDHSNDFHMSTSQEAIEEANDVLTLRQLIASHHNVLSGMLHQHGFERQVSQLRACVRGSRENGVEIDGTGQKLLPGSNQPAPQEHNTWTETWKGPEEEDEEWQGGEEEQDAGMLDAENLLGEVTSTPDKAAGLGIVSRDQRSLAQWLGNRQSPIKTAKTSIRVRYQEADVEDADCMPDSAPERSPVCVLSMGSQRSERQHSERHHAHIASNNVQTAMHSAPRASAGAAEEDGEAEASGEEEQEKKLLRPRRKFTKTQAISVVANTGPQSPEASAQVPLMSSSTLEEMDGEEAGRQTAVSRDSSFVMSDETPEGIGQAGVLGDSFRADLGANEGWEVAHLQAGNAGKQPALRRTQRTVTIRGRPEEEDEEDQQDGVSSQVPSSRTVVDATDAESAKASARDDSKRCTTAGGGAGDEAALASAEHSGAGVGSKRLFGVGAVFKRHADGFFYVKKMVAGGPADKAGVLVGSRVVSMDDERLYNKTADQLFNIVLGSEGTTLKLALQPAGAGVRAPEQVVMVRRAFIDENFLNATAIEPLPRVHPALADASNSVASTLGVGAWADNQLVAATSEGAIRPASQGPSVHEQNVDVQSLDAQHKVGVGVTFKKDADGYYVVKRVSEHGGAFASGLGVGDRVLSIDGHNMHRKSSQELSRCVLGPEGTSVTLCVRSQDGTVRDLEVKRLRQPAAHHPAKLKAGEGSGRRWDGSDGGERQDCIWEGGAAGAASADWDGQGEVMRLDGDAEHDVVGIGATLVRDSRGWFVVAETAPPAPDTPQGRECNLLAGDIIVQIDGIQVLSSFPPSSSSSPPPPPPPPPPFSRLVCGVFV